MAEIGTMASHSGEITLKQWETFLNGLLKPELIDQIFKCIDPVDGKKNVVTLTAITRFLNGRSKVAQRAQTIIVNIFNMFIYVF